MSCVAIELDNKKIWLVDCGAGTQQQMLKAGIWIGRVEKVFITHLHGDHCYDIVGILALRSMRQVDTPVEVFGPVGLKEMIDTVRLFSLVFEEIFAQTLTYGIIWSVCIWNGQIMRVSQLYIGFSLTVTELPTGLPFEIGWRDDDNWHVSAYPLTHRVPCFGYVFKEREQLGRFDASKAVTRGVTGALIGKLAKEGSVTLENGTTIKQSDCLVRIPSLIVLFSSILTLSSLSIAICNFRALPMQDARSLYWVIRRIPI
jgi:ribonuclease Z